MANLTSKTSHQYWYDFQDKMIYRVLTFIEGVESWLLDGDPQVEEAMERLGKALENFENVELDDLEHEPLVIKICNVLGSTRVLMFLQAMDVEQPGAASKLLMRAEELSESSTDEAGFFLRRNIVFERLRLLGRIFAKDRITLIENALREKEEDE